MENAARREGRATFQDASEKGGLQQRGRRGYPVPSRQAERSGRVTDVSRITAVSPCLGILRHDREKALHGRELLQRLDGALQIERDVFMNEDVPKTGEPLEGAHRCAAKDRARGPRDRAPAGVAP